MLALLTLALYLNLCNAIPSCADNKAICGYGRTTPGNVVRSGYLCCRSNAVQCPAGFTGYASASWTTAYPIPQNPKSRCPPNANHEICVSPAGNEYQDVEVLTVSQTTRRKAPCPDPVNNHEAYKLAKGNQVTLVDVPFPTCPTPSVSRRYIEGAPHNTPFQCKGKNKEGILYFYCTPTTAGQCPPYNSGANAHLSVVVQTAPNEFGQPCMYRKDCSHSTVNARKDYQNQWDEAYGNAYNDQDGEYYENEYDIDNQNGYISFVPDIVHDRVQSHRGHYHRHNDLHDDNMGTDYGYSSITILFVGLMGVCVSAVIGCICFVMGGSIVYGVSNYPERRTRSGPGYQKIRSDRNRIDHSDEDI